MKNADNRLKGTSQGWRSIGTGGAIAIGAVAWAWFSFANPQVIDYVIFVVLLVLSALYIATGVGALRAAARR